MYMLNMHIVSMAVLGLE